MKQKEFKKYTLLGQVGFWIIIYMLFLMSILEPGYFIGSVKYTLFFVGILFFSVYIYYYLIFPFFHRRKYLLYSFLLILLIGASLLLCVIVDYMFWYEEGEAIAWSEFPYYFFLIVTFVFLSSSYYFIEAWFQNIQTEGLLKAEKLQAELNFLKSQINPHFLFNTLNNIYAYAQTGNQKTAPMLERLSAILRFMVYDCSEANVGLTKELEAVENLLEINKMKNSEQRNIKFIMEGVKGFHLIAPLIIVNLVENACKHSDAVTNPKGYIHVKVTVDSLDNCSLEISNSIKKKVIVEPNYTGVGLENTKKRLDLQYNNEYSIEEKIENNEYHLKLNIPLKRKE